MENVAGSIAQERDLIASRSARAHLKHPLVLHRMLQYATGYKGNTDPRLFGSTETNVKAEINIPDRHELFLLADGERKVEMETVTRESTFTFLSQPITMLTLMRRGR